jgi:hypothetical protein
MWEAHPSFTKSKGDGTRPLQLYHPLSTQSDLCASRSLAVECSNTESCIFLQPYKVLNYKRHSLHDCVCLSSDTWSTASSVIITQHPIGHHCLMTPRDAIRTCNFRPRRTEAHIIVDVDPLSRPVDLTPPPKLSVLHRSSRKGTTFPTEHTNVKCQSPVRRAIASAGLPCTASP